jgi:hypothetical protein
MKFSFSGTIASFIDDEWNYVERLIDFAYINDDGHRAVGSAVSFVESASKRGGLKQISDPFD